MMDGLYLLFIVYFNELKYLDNLKLKYNYT